jgi:hypothetical protein
MSGPFHRLWILNPNLSRVGYGQYCENGLCVASLNVIGGLGPIPRNPVMLSKPVKFPPDAGTLQTGSSEGEWPDPLSACRGYRSPSGVPITLQLGSSMSPRIGEYSLKHDGEVVDSCAYNADSYSNTDPAQQVRARDVMLQLGAIVLVPRAPLQAGAYDVSITADGRKYAWSFSVNR